VQRHASARSHDSLMQTISAGPRTGAARLATALPSAKRRTPSSAGHGDEQRDRGVGCGTAPGAVCKRARRQADPRVATSPRERQRSVRGDVRVDEREGDAEQIRSGQTHEAVVSTERNPEQRATCRIAQMRRGHPPGWNSSKASRRGGKRRAPAMFESSGVPSGTAVKKHGSR